MLAGNARTRTRQGTNLAKSQATQTYIGKRPNDGAKEVRNEAYLAELDRRFADMKAGKNIISFTAEEWEKFVHEQELS